MNPMTLPQNVKDAVGNVDACRLETFDADWLKIKADLLSYEAEIEWLQAGLAKHVDRVCELESRLAAANALLLECQQTVMSLHPATYERIQSHLQGAGDEATN